MRLHIPQPCREDWSAMTPTEKGRHCAVCQKEVVDFSRADLQTIKSFFENKPTNVCGRFRTTQLQALNTRYHSLPTPSRLRQWTAAALLSMLSVGTSFGQTPVQMLPTNNGAVNEVKTNLSDASECAPTDTLVTLSGKVLFTTADASVEAALASILVSGTSFHVFCDANGNFSIQLPRSEKAVALEVDQFGYSTTTYQIVPNQDRNNLVIELRENFWDTLDTTEDFIVGDTLLPLLPAKPIDK
jgi:hypothetical protein